MTFELTIKPLSGAAHSPAAWFIPGNDPGRWLDEIAGWQVPMSELRLFILPTSTSDRTPIGVLVDCPKNVAAKNVTRAIPYAKTGGRLFLPADAAIDPPVANAEFSAILVNAINVLHPSAGLIGFSDEDALGVADLMERPAEKGGEWDAAVAGIPAAGRLLGVEPEEPPAVQNILQDGRGDIGSRAPESLPPTATESKTGQAAKQVGGAAASLAAGIILAPIKLLQALGGLFAPGAGKAAPPGKIPPPGKRQLSSSPQKHGWLDSLHEWIAKKFEQMMPDLQDARMRELDRLQHMLGEDPDMGLQYAIPLRDLGTRGQAAPGSKLTAHNTNLNLSGLNAGGQPGDPWAIPNDIRQSLTQKYREAANRELRLGRYRRAAYIFAELLGDFSSAANALEQGRYYREAAVLYRDHLNSQLKAAECLERGGLLAEAAAIYETLRMFEKTGDLHATLQSPEEATRCYRAQVEIFLHPPGDLLAAARLLEQKLAAPDEALKVLNSAWPTRTSAGKCLAEYFRLCGRLARHDEASLRIGQFRGYLAGSALGATLAGVMGEVATTYPESAIRAAAADATRMIAGDHLDDGSASDAERAKLARAVVPLAPHDRLLLRDAERFIAAKKYQPPAVRKPAGKSPAVLRQFHLDGAMTWNAVVAEADAFYSIGIVSPPEGCWAIPDEKTIVVVRGRWDGRTALGRQQVAGVALPHPCVLQVVKRKLGVTVTAGQILQGSAIAFGPSDPFPDACYFVGFLPMMEQKELLAFTDNDAGITWALYPDALRMYDSGNGALLATHAMIAELPDRQYPIQMVARFDRIYATWGRALLRYDKAGGFRIEPMPGIARGLALTPTHSAFRAAVALHEGGRLLREDGHDESFGDGLFDPLICFTRGGALIAANSDEGRIYQIRDHACHLQSRFPGNGKRLIAITATAALNEFATFATDGTVTVYQIPG